MGTDTVTKSISIPITFDTVTKSISIPITFDGINATNISKFTDSLADETATNAEDWITGKFSLGILNTSTYKIQANETVTERNHESTS